MNTLEEIAVIILVFWLLGAFAFPIALLVILVVLVIVRLLQGRQFL